MDKPKNPVDSGALTRAQRAKGMLGPVKNAKTGAVVASEEASPFAPRPVEFEFGENLYAMLFCAQDVSDEGYEAIQSSYNLSIMRLQKKVPHAERLTQSELVKVLTADEMVDALAVLQETGAHSYREERIELYVPHIVTWNVTDEDGNEADLSIEAFKTNTGIYDAALVAARKDFLRSRKRLLEADATNTETSTTMQEPSSMTGDTPSTAGETNSQTTV